MKWIIPAKEVTPGHRSRIGGKGYALSLLAGKDFTIPETVCITVDAYQAYVARTGLRERIQLELNRKDFAAMRWEEIWDCATRIRNLFLRKPMPESVAADLREGLHRLFKDKSVAVRSSAPEEDTAKASFAGLHESYLNIRGTDAILAHVRKVWASLWSDAALLYRQEIGLDAEKSAMAVVVQEIVLGNRSGVAFTQNPNNPAEGVIESVYGLNQGLVDGAVEPDRWTFDRRRETLLAHTPAVRKIWMVPGEQGIQQAPLPDKMAAVPPLTPGEAQAVFAQARKAEAFFGTPQDVEWTYRQKALFLLQSRPITTGGANNTGDNRSWYLSLHRSFENLKALRTRIEGDLIPGMIAAADKLARIDPADLSDAALAAEIKRRWEINQKWVNIYWEEFIPFAHGARLLGQVYNDAVQPEDPYEFVDLLSHTEMASLERNQMLEDLARQIRDDARLARQLKKHRQAETGSAFAAAIDTFVRKFGDLSCAVTGGSECVQDTEPLIQILLEMAGRPAADNRQRKSAAAEGLKKTFLACFEGEQRTQAAELLDLARTSYQLRDDDNIYLGRIEAHLLAAVQEARRRMAILDPAADSPLTDAALGTLLTTADQGAEPAAPDHRSPGVPFHVNPRQLTGQPAGPGIARGRARVIRRHADLAAFKNGDILVCDAVDPNMTFVVPLAAAVVERRGGMLIHGAIIAREYGLACVTGIPDATELIQTGDQLTVDGYLGIVTIGSTDI